MRAGGFMVYRKSAGVPTGGTALSLPLRSFWIKIARVLGCAARHPFVTLRGRMPVEFAGGTCVRCGMRFSPPSFRAADRRRSVAGFTLVELLVVIVIIAILAALVMPAYASVKRKGQQTASINNLRQWGAALAASLADNNNTFPADGQVSLGTIDPDKPAAWFNRLPIYMGEKPLSDRKADPPKAGQKSIWINPAVPTSVNAGITGDKFLFCYGMNCWLFYTKDKEEKYLSMPAVEFPSGTVFMAETNEIGYSVANPEYILAYFGTGDPEKNPDNVANFVFCDGHVASLKRSEFSIPAATDYKAKTLNAGFTFIPYVGAEH